jgi:hypothetical protein
MKLMYGNGHMDNKNSKSMNGNSSIPRNPAWKKTLKNNKVYYEDEFATVAEGDMPMQGSNCRHQETEDWHYDHEYGEDELGDEEGDFEEGDEEFEYADADALMEACHQGVTAKAISKALARASPRAREKMELAERT